MSDSSAPVLKEDSLSAREPVSAADVLKTKYDITDLGDPDTLVNTILQLVVEQRYERAITEIQEYQRQKNAYPQYEAKTSRYFTHACETIGAIRTKKAFPNMAGLPMSKQQELEERIRRHFNDLKNVLQRVGQIEKDLRLQDARSTIWVFQTMIVCILVIFIVAITREALMTLGTPFSVILEDVINWAVDLSGL